MKEFFSECRNAKGELPYNIKINDGAIDMKGEYIVLDLPFIFDCDTTLQYYMTNPIYDYCMDSDSLVLRHDSYRVMFSTYTFGCFDYKDYIVVVYTFPLADPNYYQCYTINTYTKKGIRIDRIPFFILRYDSNLEEDEFDPEWLELSGYIDESFEITICKRTQWEVLHEDYVARKEEVDEDTYNNLHEYAEYHVYNISDDGHFIEVQKPHKYEADDDNNWRRVGDNKQDNSKYTNH